MDLIDLLPTEHIVVPLEGPDLRAAIGQLLDRLERSGAVQADGELRGRIRDEPLREVVGLSPDVAIAQYRSVDVRDLALAIGVAPDGLSAEGTGRTGPDRPRIVALILAPQDAAPLYLQATSSLARLLRQPRVVDAIARQPDADGVAALRALRDLEIRPNLAVRDVMSHRVRAVPPDASVRQTLTRMVRRRLRTVPVVGEKGEVLGIVNEADIMRSLLPQIPRVASDDTGDSAILDRPVRDIMTRSVLCVSEDLGVGEVASMMINKDVEQLPVVKAGKITGMVSRSDIIRKLFYRP